MQGRSVTALRGGVRLAAHSNRRHLVRRSLGIGEPRGAVLEVVRQQHHEALPEHASARHSVPPRTSQSRVNGKPLHCRSPPALFSSAQAAYNQSNGSVAFMRDGPLRQLRRYRRKEELNLPWGSTLLARPLQPTFGPHRNAPRPSAEARDEKPIVTHCSGMGSAPRRMHACSMAFANACERKPDHPWSRMKPIRGFLVQVSKAAP